MVVTDIPHDFYIVHQRDSIHVIKGGNRGVNSQTRDEPAQEICMAQTVKKT